MNAVFWTVWISLTYLSLATSTFLDLQFELVLKKVPEECERQARKTVHGTGEQCQLSYAVGLLETFGTFDLQAVMLMDGHIRETGQRRHFKENTVVAIPSRHKQLSEDSQLYVGIKVYGLPSTAQDYFVLDAAKALLHPDHKTRMNIETSDLLFRARLHSGKIRHKISTGGCVCEALSCGCCEHLNIPKIHLDDTGCVNITYLPKPEYGISLTFSIDGWVLYNETVSARNPPPMCFEVPHLKEYASLCLKLFDLEVSESKFHGCVKLEAELYHVKVAEHDFGCFNIPVSATKRINSDDDDDES